MTGDISDNHQFETLIVELFNAYRDKCVTQMQLQCEAFQRNSEEFLSQIVKELRSQTLSKDNDSLKGSTLRTSCPSYTDSFVQDSVETCKFEICLLHFKVSFE